MGSGVRGQGNGVLKMLGSLELSLPWRDPSEKIVRRRVITGDEL